MANKDQYKAEDFIKAIQGSGGIISVIASRVGCQWHTAKKYIEEYTTVKQAYDNECEQIIDISESVVIGNIKYAAKLQADAKIPVDSGDAKWWLTKKGKGRGFGDKLDIDLKSFDITKLSTEQLERIAKGEDVYNVITNTSDS